jgi:hypothetical protein
MMIMTFTAQLHRGALGALALTFILQAAATAAPPAHCDGRWSAAPGGTPSNNAPDGPVLGNGALAVAVSETAPSGAANTSTLQFNIDRNDAFVPATGDISCCGYDMDGAGGRTLGHVSLAFPANASANPWFRNFRATQHIANGTVTTASGTDHGGTLRTASFVARGSNVLVTEVWWDVPVSPVPPPPLPLDILNEPIGCMGWTQGCYCHVLKQNKSHMWSSKQIGHPYQNKPDSTIGRRHVYKAAWATAIVAPPPGPSPTPPTPPPGPSPARPPAQQLPGSRLRLRPLPRHDGPARPVAGRLPDAEHYSARKCERASQPSQLRADELVGAVQIKLPHGPQLHQLQRRQDLPAHPAARRPAPPCAQSRRVEVHRGHGRPLQL